MATTYFGAMREPFANEGDEAPASPINPARCHNCNSSNLSRTPHRDIIDCVARYRRLQSGEHIHFECRDCGDDFTAPGIGTDDD